MVAAIELIGIVAAGVGCSWGALRLCRWANPSFFERRP